jgi:site-specific recombinase XerC
LKFITPSLEEFFSAIRCESQQENATFQHWTKDMEVLISWGDEILEEVCWGTKMGTCSNNVGASRGRGHCSNALRSKTYTAPSVSLQHSPFRSFQLYLFQRRRSAGLHAHSQLQQLPMTTKRPKRKKNAALPVH